MKQHSGPVTRTQQTQYLQKRFRRTACRAGTMMHYYLVYLSLTSVLMMTAGVSLHAVLKADRIDSQNSHYLNTLLRLSRDIRLDSESATRFSASDGVITATLPDGDTMTWSALNHTVSRSGTADNKQTSKRSYVFHKGTEISFNVNSETELLTVKLVEPSPHDPRISAEKDDAGAAISSALTPSSDQLLSRTVEILVRLNDPGRDS